MPSERTRRSYLGTLGGVPLGLSSREWIGLQKRVVDSFHADPKFDETRTVRADGDGFVVGGRKSNALGLARIDSDGRTEWSRDYSMDGEEFLAVRAVGPEVEDGYVAAGGDFAATYLFRTDAAGRERWRAEIDLDGVRERQHVVAREVTTGPDGSVYVAGSVLPGDEPGRNSIRGGWVRKYGSDGSERWTFRPEFDRYHGGRSVAGVRLLEGRTGGVRIGFYADRDSERALVVHDLGADGSVRNQRTFRFDGHAVDLYPAERGYTGVIKRHADDDSRADWWYDCVRVDDGLTTTNRMRPDVPGTVLDAVGLEEGFLVGSSLDLDSASRPTGRYLSRVAADGSQVWSVRIGSDFHEMDVAETGGVFAAMVDGVRGFEQRDGDTLDPVLGLAGVGAAIAVLGSRFGGEDDAG